MHKRVLMMLLVMAAAGAYARIINVPAQYATIQSAINASVNGDTVLVAPGTYPENINFRGKRIVLTSRWYLDRNPASITSTIVNGGSPVNPDTASCVIINSGEDSTTVLQGFTLTGGRGTRWLDEHGAGVYVEGGGILIQYSSPVIQFNRIIGNAAARTGSGVISAGGGGIRVGDGRPRLLNNVIINNTGMYGAGVVLNYTGGILRNNIIANNWVIEAVPGAPTFGGGGVWVWQSFGTAEKIIENNTIVNNSVAGAGGQFAGRGGGILVGSTTAIIRNNIIWGNAQTTGGQIGVIVSGSANVSYSNVEGGFTGIGNINMPPQFDGGTFRLAPGSPCIDAGDTSQAFNDPPDSTNPMLARFPARGTLRNDLGAYGGSGSHILGDLSTSVGERGDEMPDVFVLENYPNPFNPSTTIRFQIRKVKGQKSDVSHVTMKVFDILGCEVAALVDEPKTTGEYSVVWDASNLAGGVYYCTLHAGEQRQTRAMVLLR